MRDPEALLVELMQRPMRDPRETPQQLLAGAPQTWQGRSTPQEGAAIAAAMRALGVTPALFTDGTTSRATYEVASESLLVRWSRTVGLCTLTLALTKPIMEPPRRVERPAAPQACHCGKPITVRMNGGGGRCPDHEAEALDHNRRSR